MFTLNFRGLCIKCKSNSILISSDDYGFLSQLPRPCILFVQKEKCLKLDLSAFSGETVGRHLLSWARQKKAVLNHSASVSSLSELSEIRGIAHHNVISSKILSLNPRDVGFSRHNSLQDGVTHFSAVLFVTLRRELQFSGLLRSE